MKNERIQVHHNYISAVSSLEHKKDLINRLKRSDTGNIPAYEAEMSRHMTLHEDVIERVLNILKQDDYYRTLKDLAVIDELTAYDNIKLFPELYDTNTIVERITAEADLIERQLKQPGMYPQNIGCLQTTFNLPKAKPQPTSSNNSSNSSPQSSIPCGQRTPAASTSSSDAPSTQTQYTSPHPNKQHTPSKTDLNQPSQFSITEEDQQRVPKSADGTKVKRSKQQTKQPDEHLCFYCKLPGHLQRNCPELPYCSQCRTREHTKDRCNKTQKTRCTHLTGEPRDQPKRRDDLPQFSGSHNKCLQCRGDHPTTSCMRWQSPSANASTTGTGFPSQQHAPSTSSTFINNSQSPTTRSQSTLHVGTPTLNINAPPFPPISHQAPLPPHANKTKNFYTNVPNANTPPHTLNMHVPPPFNLHVPPPYFPQYPVTTSPSVHSSDSSILLALQKQWERQEKLDMERNQMEKEKEERKRMKEEHEQRKEDQKQMEK